jgi:hypothetical protein
MRTLSIRQPWCWLITRPDLKTPAERFAAVDADVMKRVENRDWATAWRGEFLIHSGVGLVQRDYRELQAYLLDEFGIRVPDFTDTEQVPRGGICGITTLIDCVQDYPSRFFMGPHGLVLQDSKPLPFVPWKGQLGWFDVPRSAVGLPALELA